MAVNHEIPKCQKCKNYMTLRHQPTKDRHGNDIYTYYCDNPDCPNQKEIEVVEGK